MSFCLIRSPKSIESGSSAIIVLSLLRSRLVRGRNEYGFMNDFFYSDYTFIAWLIFLLMTLFELLLFGLLLTLNHYWTFAIFWLYYMLSYHIYYSIENSFKLFIQKKYLNIKMHILRILISFIEFSQILLEIDSNDRRYYLVGPENLQYK